MLAMVVQAGADPPDAGLAQETDRSVVQQSHDRWSLALVTACSEDLLTDKQPGPR